MRINRYIASAGSLSRRHADELIKQGRVKVNGVTALTAQDVKPEQQVTLDNQVLNPAAKTILLMINKPIGYIVSRKGQGAPTIYSLLEQQYKNLKPIGRLDKDSTGLLLMSNNGELINHLAHPSFNKQKVYSVVLNKELTTEARKQIEKGLLLDDGLSKMKIEDISSKHLTVILTEGRNRQIRRTFKALGYDVVKLERTAFGSYRLGDLKPGESKEVSS